MIDNFDGPERFLSNFWYHNVSLDGLTYTSVEHAYQAAKTTNAEEREVIRSARTCGDAKRLGQVCTLRPDWEEVKIPIMFDLVFQKFSDRELAKKLDATGNQILVEGNTWGDTFWGVCRGVGENHLGKILMAVRSSNRGD